MLRETCDVVKSFFCLTLKFQATRKAEICIPFCYRVALKSSLNSIDIFLRNRNQNKFQYFEMKKAKVVFASLIGSFIGYP